MVQTRGRVAGCETLGHSRSTALAFGASGVLISRWEDSSPQVTASSGVARRGPRLSAYEPVRTACLIDSATAAQRRPRHPSARCVRQPLQERSLWVFVDGRVQPQDSVLALEPRRDDPGHGEWPAIDCQGRIALLQIRRIRTVPDEVQNVSVLLLDRSGVLH